MAGIYKRNRRPWHNFPSCENRIFPFAFFNVSALAAAALEPRPAESPAAVLLPSLLESEQLDACGHGGGFVSCKAEKSLIPAAVAVDTEKSRIQPNTLKVT